MTAVVTHDLMTVPHTAETESAFCIRKGMKASIFSTPKQMVSASAHVNMKYGATLVWLQGKSGKERTGTAVSLLKIKLNFTSRLP